MRRLLPEGKCLGEMGIQNCRHLIWGPSGVASASWESRNQIRFFGGTILAVRSGISGGAASREARLLHGGFYMFDHGASLRSRLGVAFLATALFVAPAVPQTVIVGVNVCWRNCHLSTKRLKDANDWSLEQAQKHFVDCMNENCGGMGEGS